MATMKKSFDAVAESRRWRRATSRRLNKLTFEQQQALLNRTTAEFFAAPPPNRKWTRARKLVTLD
jgi:very-short-patch-repair endonuclease